MAQRASSAREPGCEADAEGGPEELLDPRVERAEDAVELVVGDGGVVDLAEQEDGVLLPDRERRAVQLPVAPEEVLEEDKIVERWRIELKPESIQIVPVSSMFE